MPRQPLNTRLRSTDNGRVAPIPPTPHARSRRSRATGGDRLCKPAQGACTNTPKQVGDPARLQPRTNARNQ
eukprot:8812104-Alexandrium_andersonii.AAC.1